MNVKSPRAIRTAALESLSAQPGHRKVPLVYAGFSALLSLAVTIVSYILSQQIDGMTGLSNMGTRAILSTAKSVLPFVPLVFLIGWEMGYKMSALDISRRRTAGPWTLKEGFTRFGPMLRAKILMGLVFIGIGIVAMYLSSFIFMALPFSNAFYELVTPMLESATILNSGITLDEATMAALSTAMIPLFVIFGVVYLVMCVPMLYTFRMVSFCVADNGHRGALAAMKESRAMMKGRKWDLFRLDLSFWWFFLLEGAISVICYLDVILPLVGISLPWSNGIVPLGFYVLSLAGQLVLYWAALNRVTVSHAVFYDAIRPREQSPKGVPLDNIFELAKDYEE